MTTLENRIHDNLFMGTNILAQGFKHLQFQQGGCIQKKKNVDGNFYVIKNGYGTGKATDTFKTFKQCLEHLDGSGWGNIVDYK
jgi:hypothetical protein